MNATDPESAWADFDGTFEGTRRRQDLAGLELTYTERLRWLEERMTELLKLKGRAGSPIDLQTDKTDL
jgi:hypothetical protein